MQTTAEIIDGVERRTAYLLAGLEVPDGRLYEFNSQTAHQKFSARLPSCPPGVRF
jgi:hypothetical protein